jgi:DNA-binding transcriptional MerR regulator
MDKAPDAFRTISEVAADLDLPQHVLRFWETRFGQIKPMKRGGGRRYYRPEDIDLLRGIRHLLYGEGYTIRGVQRILKDEGIKFVQSVWKDGAPQPERPPADQGEADERSAPARPLPGRGTRGDPETERGRGLFGLLPSLLGSGSDDAHGELSESRIEPSIDEIFAELPPLPRGEFAPDPTTQDEELSPIASPAAPNGPAQDRRTPAADLGPEGRRKLQAMLHELGECRRLLEESLAD